MITLKQQLAPRPRELGQLGIRMDRFSQQPFDSACARSPVRRCPPRVDQLNKKFKRASPGCEPAVCDQRCGLIDLVALAQKQGKTHISIAGIGSKRRARSKIRRGLLHIGSLRGNRSPQGDSAPESGMLAIPRSLPPGHIKGLCSKQSDARST